MRLRLYFFALALAFFCKSATGQIISTFIGNGNSASYVDGYPAEFAGVGGVAGIVKTPSGRFIFVEQWAHKIRFIDSDGLLGTLAGTGTLGYAGDGGQAVNAQLNMPTAITVDNAGNVYFIDQFHTIIRRISTAGIITTVAGGNGTGNSGDGGQVNLAKFTELRDLCFDNAGNLYIADAGANVVRKVNMSTGIITTVAGNGLSSMPALIFGDNGPATSARLGMPFGIVVDNAGNLYIADWYSLRIRKVNTAGVITTIAGNSTIGTAGDGGPASAATFMYFRDLALDNAGNLYIADEDFAVRKITMSTGIITRFAGNGTPGLAGDGGPPASAQLSPYALFIDTNGDLYISDRTNHTIRVVHCPAPKITKQPPADTSLCAGANVQLSIIATGASGYQWQLNTGAGWNNVTNNGTYSGATTTALTITGATSGMNNYQYRCVTSNSCGTLISSATILHVTNPVTPTISITQSAGDICMGTTITFTAAITNGGTAPVYQWKKNGVNVGGNSDRYNENLLQNGDVITCVLVSNVACATSTTATSNSITISTPAIVPTLSIHADKNNFCSGTNVFFTSTATGRGTINTYQWKKNGVNVGNNAAAYADNTLINGDVITCVFTTNSNCASPATVTSNAITMVVTTTITPSIAIASPVSTICAGSPLTFTAAITGGGDAPAYQWKRNGVNVGTNSRTYTNAGLTNGDIITCVLTSNASCATSATATSNPITVTVNAGAPSVSIVSGLGNTSCAGITVAFRATAINGGASPAYQWKKNGVNVGINDPSYIDNTLVTGDVISCVLTSSAPCVTPSTATSNTITMTINAAQAAPTVSIAASVPDICAAAGTVTFTATVTNPGASGVYYWTQNGVFVGTNSPTYTHPGVLTNGTIIKCEYQAVKCGVINAAISNMISVNCPCGSSSGIITRFAGIPITGPTTIPHSSPDGSPAATSMLNYPFGIAIRKTDGKVFITETFNDRIRSIDASGNLTTVAGGGVGGDGPALAASVIAPRDIISDNAGNIYFCENGQSLRKLDLAGNITTIAGAIQYAHAGDGGPAALASYWNISDVAIDNAGNLYLPEWGNSDIRRIDAVTGIVTTIAGIPGVQGNSGNGGPATAAMLDNPRGIVCDNAGNVYFISGMTEIRKIDISTGIISRVAGMYHDYTSSGDNIPAINATLNGVFDLAFDDVGNLYAIESGAAIVRKIGTDGIMTRFAGTAFMFGNAGDGGPADVAEISPQTVTAAPGAVYIVTGDGTIRKVSCPLVTIDREPVDTVLCTSTGNVSFSIKACNATNYQWQVNTGSGWTSLADNGTYAGTHATVLQITGATAAMNNYQYRSIASKSCGADTSLAGTLRVATAAPATVSIIPSASTICTGTSVVFTATPGNGGTQPVYQWKKNGLNVGTNSTTFTDITLGSADVITCELTSNAACAAPAIVMSNAVSVSVSAPATPVVSVAVSANNVCLGASVTFTATGSNAGASPVYQWKKNGLNVGTNSTTYTDITLANGDIVTCTMTASITCGVTGPVNSNAIVMIVNDPVTASITIATGTPTVCAGTMVNFTSTITNGGAGPVYQWKKNGVNVGTNSATYSDNTLINGDVVTCQLTSNANCIAEPLIASNSIVININTPLAPTIEVASSATTICAGTMVSFTSTITNGGVAPAFQWKKNGTNVGTNSATYSDITLNNGDVITCVLTSNQACISSTTATSNSITITHTAAVTPTIVIAASDNSVCSGTSIRFTAAITNGGATPVYQWKKNGINVGTNSPVYTDNTLINGNVITCVLTTSIACVTSATATSNAVTMSILSVVAPAVTITASDITVCPGTEVFFTAVGVNQGDEPVYQWKKNGVAVGGISTPYYFGNGLNNNDIVTCELTSDYGCAAPVLAASNTITMSVSVAPVVNLDQTPGLCEGTTRILDAGNYASWTWSDGSITRTLPVATTGTWSVTVTDADGCQGTGSTTITTLYPVPTGFLPTDTTFCDYETLVLSPYTQFDSYVWSNGSINNSIIVNRPNTYTLEVTDNNDCKGIASVIVAYKDCLKGLFVPNAFTPNGDGKNDVFRANLPGNVKQFKMQVFNKWGNLIFKTANVADGWDGKYKGQYTGTDVYVWICVYQLDGEPVKTAKGTITLIR